MAEEAGDVDALVNNVGDMASSQTSWRELDEATLDHVLDVDIKGTMLMVHEFGVRMLDRGARGAIVNIGSTVIVRGSPRAPIYAAGKYGLLGITKSYAKALAPHVRVNTFAPGFMDTPAVMNRPDMKSGRLRAAAARHADGPDPAAGGADRRGAVPRHRRREPHHRQLHDLRRRLLDAGRVGPARAGLARGGRRRGWWVIAISVPLSRSSSASAARVAPRELGVDVGGRASSRR